MIESLFQQNQETVYCKIKEVLEREEELDLLSSQEIFSRQFELVLLLDELKLEEQMRNYISV